MSTISELDGRVALVTGAGRGIGLDYARRLADAGATVVLADRDEESVVAAAKELREAGRRATHATVDIADAEACTETVDGVAREHGTVDILVNNAALYRDSGFGPSEELSLDKWRRMIDVNVSGTFFMCRAAIPHMKKQRWGRIVNQSSISAYTTVPGSIHYSMSKAAVVTMTKTLARELGPFGITVNAIAPGVIDTETTLLVMTPDMLAGRAQGTALRRIGHPDDLSPLLVFLCSSGADYISGQTIVVDGGTVMLG